MAGEVGSVVTFGEAMVRLTPPGNERLERTTSLDLTVGGAELNSAATLACLEVPATWVSRLPDVPLGRAVARGARAAGVDLSHLHGPRRAPAGRASITSRKPPIPVRRRSTTTVPTAPSRAWRPGRSTGRHPRGARALHISGITPGARTRAARGDDGRRPRRQCGRCPVAFDLNYRSKLWSETEARACFAEIVPLVDILFASRGTLRTFFNIDGEHAEVLDAARTRLGLAVTILSRKRGKASRSVRLGSMAMGRDGQAVEGPWRDVEVVDRLGGGDAFAGGFIASYIADPDDLARALGLGFRGAGAQAHHAGRFPQRHPRRDRSGGRDGRGRGLAAITASS